MKKVIGIILAVLVVAGIVAFMVWKAQSGYTSVLTGKVVRQDLATVVSGTGQIKPKTYVNVGATSFGRITHLEVKEGDHVTKGQVLARVENVQPEANVDAQQAMIASSKTDVASYIAAEATAKANVEHAQADLEQKRLDWDRAQALYKGGIMAKQDFDAKKAAYDLAVATLSQSNAAVVQAKAQTDSAKAKVVNNQATLRSNVDALDKTVSVAPFDGIVTNLPVREGETVVVGIQNAEGSTLMTLADMSVITAEVKVDETDIVSVKLGHQEQQRRHHHRCHRRIRALFAQSSPRLRSRRHRDSSTLPPSFPADSPPPALHSPPPSVDLSVERACPASNSRMPAYRPVSGLFRRKCFSQPRFFAISFAIEFAEDTEEIQNGSSRREGQTNHRRATPGG